jgi:hypothetical protein
MTAVREISPAVGISAEEYVALLPPAMRQLVNEIRRRKQAGERLRPSGSLIDYSALLTREHRNDLLDGIASLVDENYAGRAETCLQFADLLNRALTHLRFPSRPVVGTAMYYDPTGTEISRWTRVGANRGRSRRQQRRFSCRKPGCSQICVHQALLGANRPDSVRQKAQRKAE